MQGIYAIVNTVRGTRYVGSSTDVALRWSQHVRRLDGGYHDNSRIQRDWNEFGSDAFTLVVLEEVIDFDNLITREQAHIDATVDRYNVCDVAARPPSQLGRIRSAESRARIRASQQGRKHKPLTEAHRARLRHPHSAEHNAKIRASRLGQKNSIEARAKMSAAALRRNQLARIAFVN